jgi:protein-S-isoprenylcysteine O-methyltransferase Ste14
VAESIYRPARPAATWWNVTKTLLETLVFWFVFLMALPIGISVIEVQLAIQRFPGYPVIAAAMLALFSVIGLWAALTIAIQGRGTPLPVDEARRLVTTGPYAYVRHPLSIAFMGQGTAIVLALGSYPVMIYMFAFGLWLYYYARRREEKHLRERYGKEWEAYAREVRGYRPRLSAYRAGQAGGAGRAGG